MTFTDRPLPESLQLPRLCEPKPRDKRWDNLRPTPRVKGTQNRITRDLKEGLIEGAVQCGYDDEGAGGLIGYCRRLAERHPKVYASLLAKLLPYNLNANVAAAINEVRIFSVPPGAHLSPEQLKGIEQGKSVLDLQPQPSIEEPIAPTIEPQSPEALPQSAEEKRIINDLKAEINELAQRAGISLVV